MSGILELNGTNMAQKSKLIAHVVIARVGPSMQAKALGERWWVSCGRDRGCSRRVHQRSHRRRRHEASSKASSPQTSYRTMTFTVMVVARRASWLTPAQFREHMEEVHLPLVRSLTGPHFPASYTRRYIQRRRSGSSSRDTSNFSFPANVLIGSSDEFASDMYAELEFPDEAAFYRYYTAMSQPEAARILGEDQREFMEVEETRMVAVDVVRSEVQQPRGVKLEDD